MGILDLLRRKSLEELEEEQKFLKQRRSELEQRAEVIKENRKIKLEINKSKRQLSRW